MFDSWNTKLPFNPYFKGRKKGIADPNVMSLTNLHLFGHTVYYCKNYAIVEGVVPANKWLVKWCYKNKFLYTLEREFVGTIIDYSSKKCFVVTLENPRAFARALGTLYFYDDSYSNWGYNLTPYIVQNNNFYKKLMFKEF